MTEQLLTLPIGLIRPHPPNPPPHPGGLSELAASVRAAGAVSPPPGRAGPPRQVPPPPTPRRNLGDLSELAASIRSAGLLQPLLVRPATAIEYRLLDGHRRLAAAKAAGLRTVPALCRDAPLTVVALATGHKRPLSPM